MRASELLDAERLGHVVVAAEREAADLVLGRIACGEEEDREPRALAAQAARHLEPVDVRHHDVEHGEVGREALDRVERLAPVAGDAHVELS